MSNYSINWSSQPPASKQQEKSSQIRYSNDMTKEQYNVPYYDTNNIAPKCVIGLDRDGVIRTR
jgi:hypothetical protein